MDKAEARACWNSQEKQSLGKQGRAHRGLQREMSLEAK